MTKEKAELQKGFKFIWKGIRHLAKGLTISLIGAFWEAIYGDSMLALKKVVPKSRLS